MKNKTQRNDRAFPRMSNPCKYTLDRIREELTLFEKLLPDQACILDFGCGGKPYEHLFSMRSKKYIGVDLQESPEYNPSTVDLMLRPGEGLPFPDEYFDAIISTQVFEHLYDIHYYANELKRVLKSGGIAFISAAFAWDYHPYPNDYWRISKDGYRMLFKEFSEIHFSYDLNTIQNLIQSMNLLISRRLTINKMINKLIYYLLNFVISRFDYNKGDNDMPGNIFVFLKK
jgi:SAM-dependent methyltransferase